MNSNDQPPPSGPLDFQPRRANDRAMFSRIQNLETQLVAVRTSVEVVRSNYVTKEDLLRETGTLRAEFHKELYVLTWRFISATLVISGSLTTAVYFIARYVH